MRKPNFILCLVLYLSLAAYVVHAAPKLEMGKIKSLYVEGEFDRIRVSLEKFLKQGDQTATREERIMAYKYLGVVYASESSGTPQAEAYFFRLFDLAPQVTLSELYVSSSVNEIFKNTKERFLSERKSVETVDEFGNIIAERKNDADAMSLAAKKQPAIDTAQEKNSKAPIKDAPDKRPSIEKKGPRIWPWVLGATVIGGGIGLYVLTSQKKSPGTDTIKVGK